MSGSPSDRFIGRSFNTPNPVNPQGYSTNTPLTSPSSGNSFLIAAHIRINGIQSTGASMLVSLDDYTTPTQGFGLGISPVADSPADADTVVALSASVFGGGESAVANVLLDDITGMFGRELFLYMWYLQDDPGEAGGSLMVGFNGKLSTPVPMSNIGSYASSGTPAILGVGCLAGVASVASVGVIEVPGGAAQSPSLQEAAQASAQLAMASMKFGRLTLFDPEAPLNGFLDGAPWDHYWTPGRTYATAPETLPDEGTYNVPMNLDVPQSDTSLIIMPGRNYASGLFLNG